MTKGNKPDKGKKPKPERMESPINPIDYDWRDPCKPRNPEDDIIVDGWRRRADGTFEKVDKEEEVEAIEEIEDNAR